MRLSRWLVTLSAAVGAHRLTPLPAIRLRADRRLRGRPRPPTGRSGRPGSPIRGAKPSEHRQIGAHRHRLATDVATLPRVSMQIVEVRDAAPEDAAAVAHVHAETWVDTYLGKVADALAGERVARARDRDWTQHTELRAELGGGGLGLPRGGQV